MPVNTGDQHKTEYIGIAAADKADDSTELYVYVQELLPFMQGELAATSVSTQVSSTGNNSNYAGSVNSTNVIKCYYRGDDILSDFPPCVRRGERVVVWNYTDTDTWYWKSEGRNDSLRKTDKKQITINATDANVSDNTSDQQYGVSMDTRYGKGDGGHKGIKIWTSKALGETFAYQIDINTDDGVVMMSDDVGNTLCLDSTNTRVTLKNKDNSLLDLNKENIVLACNQDITIMSKSGNIALKAPQVISTDSGKETTITAGTDIVETATSNVLVNGGTTVTTKTIALIDTCTSWVMNAGTTTCTGGAEGLSFKTNKFDIRKMG